MTEDPEELLSPELISRMEDLSTDEVRALRASCIEVETGLSYQRRLVQGPLDIVRSEIEHRAAGDESNLHTLLQELPEVLAEGSRPAGNGRFPAMMAPTRTDPAFQRDIDDLVGDVALGRLAELSDDELRSLTERLAEVERRLSDRRRAFHERIDALQTELTRRYVSGEASVDSLLAED